MNKQALLIFTKNPEAGKVKTRLAATVGNEAALAIYNQLLQHTVSETENLPVDKFVFYADYILHEDVWINNGYYKEVQYGNDLGERMCSAFDFAFQKGYEQVVIIGTDCPEISSATIINAFASLERNDVVIGPAEDGGYYLLGMKQLHSGLFEQIQWSTPTVLANTISKIKRLHLTHHLLPVMKDIDEEQDLAAFKHLKQ